MRAVSERGPYQNGVARRIEIINAATSVFAAEGYAGGSLRRIAAKVGVTEPAVLRLFGTKKALLLATLAHWAPHLEILHTHPETKGIAPLAILRAQVARHQQLEEPRRLYTVITAEASSGGHPARDFVVERQARQLARLSTALIEASSTGEISQLTQPDAESEARLILALLQGLELQWFIEPAMDVPALLDSYLKTTGRHWPATDNEDQSSTRFN